MPAPHVVVASAPRGRTLSLGAALPDEVADELAGLLGPAIGPEVEVADTAAPPPSAERCTELVTGARGPVTTVGAVCFLIERELDDLPVDTGAIICTSEMAGAGELRPQLSEREVDEARGPWATVVIDGAVVSVCCTARSFEGGAEAGTWTSPAFRGRGFAAAATVAWSRMVGPTTRFLFYSTGASNTSSQGVAARLGLQPLGRMWKLVPTADTS